MTTMDREVKKCAVCGSKHEYTVIASTNSFGAPDLDLRPPEMERSTMSLWVQECPDCGYVASNITNKPGKVTKEWLASQAYVTCDGIRFRSGLASRFYKQYKISLLNTKTEQAFCAIHHAAWACDDRRDVRKAMICRDLAIPLIEKLIEEKHENAENFLLMKADLLRRAGHFERVAAEYSDMVFENDTMDKVRLFQLKKAAEKDTGCYTVQDALDSFGAH